MEHSTINQTQAIEKLKAGEDISNYTIEFNDEKIEALQGILLSKHHIQVPEHLIFYKDEAIDFGEEGDLIDEELEKGKVKWTSEAKTTKEQILTQLDFLPESYWVQVLDFAAFLVQKYKMEEVGVDEIDEYENSGELSQETKDLLIQRISDYEKNPEGSVTWDEMKAELTSKYGYEI